MISTSSYNTIIYISYRAEAWIESHVGGPLYQYQSSLPKLPVPSIENTLQRFLPTALPLAKSAQEARNLQTAVDKFAKQAAPLQQRLLARSNEYSNSSWLQHWWNTLGYLDVRDSVVINVSYYFHFADDSTVYDYLSSTSAPSAQIRRAAALLFTTAQVRNQVVSGTWPPQLLGKPPQQTPLCNTAFKYLFHACRIPHSPRDSYRIYDPALHTHAAVMVKGHIFTVPLVEPGTHQPVSLATLEASLQMAVDKAHQAGDAAPAMGLSWCTTSNRDDWAAARDSLDASTLQALAKLESAACLVCLDDCEAHTTRDMGHLLLHGQASATPNSPINRWFDKSLQYIVTKNGKAGLNGEHSMMDGMPVVTLADKLSTVSYEDCIAASNEFATDHVDPFADFVLPPASTGGASSTVTRQHIQKAMDDFDSWVGEHELHPCRFAGYGSQWIKDHAKASPDAYVQMAMQVSPDVSMCCMCARWMYVCHNVVSDDILIN